MSREFHWTHGGYFHSILGSAEECREVTGEPVADAIRDVLIALAPVEYAVASHQACDSSLSRVVLAAAKNEETVRDAVRGLLKALGDYSQIVASVVDAHAEGRLNG